MRYDWQGHEREVTGYSGSDWAGCRATRKSTSGGCVMAGSHLLKSWASTQPTITLSSGEAELYGVVRGGAIGLGFLVNQITFAIILMMSHYIYAFFVAGITTACTTYITNKYVVFKND